MSTDNAAAQPGADQDKMADEWAAALAEAKPAEPRRVRSRRASRRRRSPTSAPAAAARRGAGNDINMILDIPVQLTVELGRTRIPIKHILQLAQGSVVELETLAGEPMDVLVNGYLIAQGEVVVVNDKFGIRLTDIVTPSERMRRLSKTTEPAHGVAASDDSFAFFAARLRRDRRVDPGRAVAAQAHADRRRRGARRDAHGGDAADLDQPAPGHRRSRQRRRPQVAGARRDAAGITTLHTMAPQAMRRRAPQPMPPFAQLLAKHLPAFGAKNAGADAR